MDLKRKYKYLVLLALWWSAFFPQKAAAQDVATDSVAVVADTYVSEEEVQGDIQDEEESTEEQAWTISQPEEIDRPATKNWTDDQWKNVSKEPDYSGEKEKPEVDNAEEIPDYQPVEDSHWLADLFESRLVQIILFSVLIVLLLVFIVQFMGQHVERRNRKLGELSGYSIESLEENLEESDLDRYLRMALDANDFKAAVRIFYLAIIKSLHERKWIKWKREKTNFDYVYEMRPTSYFKRFLEVTRAFEMVWYGDIEVTEREYRLLEVEFRKFIAEIDGGR